jgi:hypothetical protein
MNSENKVLCIACGKNHHAPESGRAGVSLSRYVDQIICSDCGIREALEGFFWSDGFKPREK